MKYYNVINSGIEKGFSFFDILLTDKNDTNDYLLFDNSGLNQEVIKISLLTETGILDDIEVVVYSRFANGYVFRVLPITRVDGKIISQIPKKE